MKKFSKVFGVLLGLSIVTATAVTGFAVSAANVNEISESDKLMWSEDGKPICPEGVECYYVGNGAWCFEDKTTDVPDLTGMTPTEHNEYADGDFYIVDDIYVETDDASVRRAWGSKTVTVVRSIYNGSNNGRGTLYVTMNVTAKFKWDGETARIIGAPNCSFTKADAGKDLDIIVKAGGCGSGQGSNSWFGKKYAYAEYVIKTDDFSLFAPIYATADFRIWIDVNKDGELTIAN